MQRRALFSHLSRLAAALAWQQVCAHRAQARGQVPQPDAWHAADEVFTLGVASGEPRPDSVVIWTRLAPKPLQADGGMPAQAVPVRWEVAADARFARVLQSGSAVADPAAAHSVHVEVKGLPTGRPCFYRFEAGGQRSPVGRTRTAPDPTERNTRMRVALASCQHYETGYYTVHREIAVSDVDLVLFVGDYIYGTQAKPYARVRRHPHVMPDLHRRTLADYRQHYAAYKLDPDLRACHAAHPWLMVWDDHEVSADYTGRHSPDLPDPQAFLAVRTAAYQAYFEHLPFSPHRAPVGGSMPLHGRYPWGQLVDLMTVDTRQFRDPAVCDGRHAPMNGKLLWQCDAAQAPERTMLGQSQAYDVAAALASSTCDWKFIVQSSQMSPGVLRSPLGPLLYADGWDAYPAARRRFTEAIAQPRVPDVVCLGGDVHRHVAANLRLDPADPASPIIASEIVTTSVSSRGLSELMSSWVKRSNPDLLHVRGDERGYVLLDITPRQVQIEFRSTPHPVRADSRLRTQARYVIERGQPGPRKA
ncbi:MAG: phosphodiesterase [Burkholderiales bacterium RIFCSPLOWO2_12_FULL_64_99]|nr:MAG: phosphodiesterase [Burkholderiales bacterium RIFCSPHIGHO2_12_FULL_63_20]OGB61878.1 MAG: phosphodiesterase [Burkholderiales bacterium RIFCSPLOWO2_12_FULL_64_99]